MNAILTLILTLLGVVERIASWGYKIYKERHRKIAKSVERGIRKKVAK